MTATITSQTRTARLSARKLATLGAAYEAEWIGTPVVFTTYEGDRIAGTLTHFDGGYPVATFADGRWARLDLTVEIPLPTFGCTDGRHSHGLDDVAAYVVTVTRITPDGVTRDDSETFAPNEYGHAVAAARWLRGEIAAGRIDATYAVIDTVYANGCRL